MKRTELSAVLICAFSILVLIAQTAYCNYIPLGTINAGGDFGINRSANSPTLKLAWGTPFNLDPRYWPRIMDTEMDFGVFTSADIGRTVSVSSGTTGFNTFSSLLTNGTDDQFMVWSLLTWNTLPGYTPGRGGQDAESRWFQSNGHKFVNSPYADFYGYEITRIDLTINSLNIWVSSYQDPITTVWTTYTNFSYDATYTVYGTPEPATLLLLTLGGLILRKRKA